MKFLTSKNHLARNMQVLQVFFLQDLALNLAHIFQVYSKNEAFLANPKNLARFL